MPTRGSALVARKADSPPPAPFYARLYRIALAAAIYALLAAACGRSETSCQRAIYYWKLASPPSLAEWRIIYQSRISRLYVHVADIGAAGEYIACRGQDAKAFSLASKNPPSDRLDISLVPVVYIDAKCFLEDGRLIPKLANNIAGLLSRKSWLAGAAREVQIDCDWTAPSRDAYFGFLREMRAELRGASGGRDISLSVTLRLHQLRDRAGNGIAPADRCMLMAYNFGDIADPGEPSAILDLGKLKGYLKTARDYPLPLDVALPAWSWVAQFEGSSLIGLIDDPEAAAGLKNGPYRRLSQGRYEAVQSGLLCGKTVERGDLFVLDESSPGKTQAAASLIARSIGRGHRSVAMYHLDDEALCAFAGYDKRVANSLRAAYSPFERP